MGRIKTLYRKGTVIDQKKKDYAKKHGFTIHKATREDNGKAMTDFGRNSDYYVKHRDGRSLWAGSGSWQDLRDANKLFAGMRDKPKKGGQKK